MFFETTETLLTIAANLVAIATGVVALLSLKKINSTHGGKRFL